MKFVLFMSTLIAGISVFADAPVCSNELVLTCSSTYQTVQGTAVNGPTADANYANLQPEPFDPPDCEAAVVLYTYVGKFVMNVGSQAGDQHAFLDSNGVEAMLNPDPGTSMTFTVVSPFKGDVTKAVFTCRVYNQD